MMVIRNSDPHSSKIESKPFNFSIEIEIENAEQECLVYTKLNVQFRPKLNKKVNNHEHPVALSV